MVYADCCNILHELLTSDNTTVTQDLAAGSYMNLQHTNRLTLIKLWP